MTNFKRFLTLTLIATLSAFCMHVWGAALTIPYSWGASDGSSAYTDALGCTKTSLGSDYSSAPKLKFNNTGSSLTIQVASAPGTVTFNFKQNGTDPGTFVVQESADNNTYTTVKTVTWPGDGKTTSVTATLSSTARYIKLLHQTKGSGTNAAVGGVSITAGSSCSNTPTMSFTDAMVNKTTDDVSYTQTVNISGKGSGQTVAYSSSDESIGEVNTSGVVTLKGKVGSTTITASVEASGTYCSASASYTINVTQAPIDVTLHYKGTTATLDDQTNPYTLPTTGTYVANACDAWTFDGWYGSTYAKSTSKPTYITQLTSTSSAYAVYKHTEGGGGGETYNFTQYESLTSAITIATGVTATFDIGDGASAPTTTYGNEVRVYGSNTITIQGTGLTRIAFTYTGTKAMSPSVGSISAGVWTGSANEVTFTLAGGAGNNKITAITVGGGGTTYYSTDAECGPKVQATASPWVTSTQGIRVKVEVPVTATNFDANCTLSASVSNLSFSIVGWGANGNSVTAGEDLTTSLILEYNPTIYSSDATITFNSTYSGGQTPVYTPGTVHGRSLSGLFVIAIKNGGTWYALPADMSGSGTYAGVTVDVDDVDNPTKVTAGPATALYRLMGVHNSRYTEYGTRVRFMSEYNSKCLWSNAATGGTGINNGAIPNNANSDNYEWTLVTTDGVTYAINTNVAKKIEEGRELRYFAGESRFGMYASGNSSFRLLKVDCWTRATVSAVSTTYNSVTLTWAGKSGTSYNVYIDEGGVTKKTETDVTSPITISGLSPETNYTWIISPGTKDDGCAYSGDFTTNVSPINVTLSCDGTEYPLGPQDKPYTLPTSGVYVNNACAEWEFVGWTADTHSKSTTAPTLITQMTTDGTAYAVYKKTEGGGSEKYVRITATEQITNGQYLIMCNSYGAADDDPSDDYDYFTALKGSYNSSFDAADVNYISNVKRNTVEDTIGVTPTTTANEVTITAVTGGHTIKTKSNYYIGRTATSNGINSSTSEAYVNTLSISSNNFQCKGSGGNIYLKFNTSWTGFRYYGSGQENVQLYKRTTGSTYYYATSSECCNEVAPPTVVVEPLDESATISWDSQVGATNGYHVTCSNGTDQDVPGTSLVISSLDASTTYTYTVTAKGGTCNRSVEGSFTTASCSDVPTDVTISAGTHTATIRWTASASTATVVIYDDDLGTSIVQSVANQTSPCEITGLNDNTNYYLQVFAGGSCPHPIKPFTTQSTAVSIAEWFPNGININLNADEATATVLIEDKQENTTASTSYAEGLFFSKYYEAYKNIKLWAVYNGTEEKISLANIKVKSSNNGSEWGKSSGTDDNQKITSLALYGHHEAGYIYPGEEIIVYNNGNDEDDAAIISCMESTYGTAYRTDADSVWYLVKNLTTSLSGDDGLLLLNGTDTLDVIGGINANTAYTAANSQPTWGDNDGWNCNDGEDAEGNTLALSTNRCLLVRKNTVKSGLNAVAQNRDYFNTLCDEWWGAQVPDYDDPAIETQTSCDNFSYVGHYDYNSYYAHFDSITTVDELSGHKNPDGTYTIPIEHLDTMSCTMLRVKVYEGGVEKASTEYKVPIMVEGSHSTKDTIFICDYPTQTRTAATCKECDVVILNGGVLTKASSDEARDNAEVRNLTIYPGGTLVVPEGAKYEYSVNSIQFRVQGEQTPVAKLKGDLITKDQQVIVSRRIKNDRYYFFSLPYDCNIADIRWSNGETPVRGVDYEIVEYDGARRATEGSTQGAPGHWTPVSGTQLKAGVGYNIAVANEYVKELIFPMAIGSTNLTNEENTKTAKTVAIHQYTGSTTINNHNWNLVAHPYVSPFEAYNGATIKAGWLKYTPSGDPGTPGEWTRESTGSVYLTMPSFNAGAITYEQTVSTDITSLNPFLAVFVQGAGEGDLTFEQTGRKLTAPARHLAAKAEDEDESIFIGVTLSGNNQTDNTYLRVRPDFTDEYELGYDLEKFITFYTARPQVYMKTPTNRLAFQALSDSAAAKMQPMGVYCYQAGTYTFSLNPDFPTDEIEAVYLYDATTGITTNLLYDTYSFSSSKQVYTNTRFALSAVIRRRVAEQTTDLTVQEAEQTPLTRKILIDGHVYILRGGKVFDVTGKQLLNH